MGSIKQTITLDSMLFIYLLETESPFHEQINKLFKIWENENIPLLTSVISVLETLSTSKLNPHPERIINYSRFFSQLPNLTLQPVTFEISIQAAALRRIYSPLRTPDSIQISTALLGNSNIFITNDDRLSKLNLPSLKILTPKDL